MTKKPRKPAPDLISKAELARRRGVARSSATRACNTFLKAATAGNLVDANHPKVRKWLREADPAPTATAPIAPSPAITELSALALRKRRAEVAQLELQVERQARRLVAAEFVRTKVFGPIDSCFHRLLTDFVTTAALATHSAVSSGASVAEVRTALYEKLSGELSRTKRSMRAGLQASSSGENPPEVQNEPDKDNTSDQRYAGARDLAQALTANLRTSATPNVVAAVVKAFARAAAGRLDEVLAEIPRVEQEAAHQVAWMLEGHVQKTLSKMAHDETQNDPS